MDSNRSMPRRRYTACIVAVFFCLICMNLSAFGQTTSPFTFHAGGGVSPLTGQISDRLNTGWHWTAGAGIRFRPAFEATLDYTYHGFGVKDSVLREFQVPDGNSHVWSLTVNPKIRIPGDLPASPYIVGGIGYYRRTVEFTTPTIAEGLVFDPFFDTFFRVPFAADQVLGSVTRSGIGGNLGAGFEVRFRAGDNTPRFFTEARYEYADTGRVPTRMIPVTFGLRW
jgi:opacity protein-like surface antigen